MTKPARPWDMFNPNIGRVSAEVQHQRITLCESCPEFLGLTRQCKACGCFMDLKTQLPHAACPIHKWAAVQPDTTK